MRILRIIVRLPVFLLTTLGCYLLIMVGRLATTLGFNGQPISSYFLGVWGHLICMVMGMKVNVSGTAPKPPFFIVSNHLSYVDVMVLCKTTQTLFVAKNEVKNWPIFGILAKTIGMIFVDREKRSDVARVNNEISDRLEKNYGVTIFPEATTSPGYEILPFKTSLLAYPAARSIPVHYATISYSTPEDEQEAYMAVSWWGEMPFLNHFINILSLRNFTCNITFCEQPELHSNRKELASTLHKYISSTFNPVIEYSKYAERHTSE